MLFVDPQFVLLFLPICFFVFEFFRNIKNKIWVLIFASLIFYSVWNPWLLILIIGSVVVNFLISKALYESKPKGLFVLGIVLNLLPLVYFKYSGLFASTLSLPIETGFFGEALGAFLPLGISFFTFQQIAYLSDVRFKGVKPPQFDQYVLFITFFPQLIAGPIVHHQEFIPQINNPLPRTPLFISGIAFFMMGFAKKVGIADNIALFVDPLYALDVHTFETSLKACLGYTFQLYFDFSGYSDMALGLAAMFGFKLPINFNSPYKSTSITDLWRRWHMTLSRWLRDYTYIPLGGNRLGTLLTYRNLMLTMLIGGLWHGAAWTFVLWGGLHGLFLALERLGKNAFPRFNIGKFSCIYAFIVTALLWVLFRAENYPTAESVYAGFLNWDGLSYSSDFGFILLAAFISFTLPNSVEIAYRIEDWVKSKKYDFDFPAIASRYLAYWSVTYFVCIASTLGFYKYTYDKTVYQFTAAPFDSYIDAKQGDFRSNLFSNQFFKSPDRKVVFVGSSFTQAMGSFEFTHDGQPYKSISLGISGNSGVVGLRTAFSILDTPNLDTIVLGVSPLGFQPNLDRATFSGECLDFLNMIEESVSPKTLGSCDSENLSGESFLKLISLNLRDEDFFQFQNFTYKMRYSLFRHPVEIESLDISSAEDIVLNLKDKLSEIHDTNILPMDLENGNNDRFKWEQRGALEMLQAGSSFTSAFKLLKAEAEARNINLIIYETPTVSHKDAPNIYPEEFYEQYLASLKYRMDELGIEFYNLGDLLPWRDQAMIDFIHADIQIRKDIQKLILLEEFSDVKALEIVKGTEK